MRALSLTIPREPPGYNIFVGPGALGELPGIAAGLAATKIAVVTDETVAALHAGTVRPALDETGIEHHLFTFPPGESAKRLETVADLAGRMFREGFDRSSAVLALGGGVVGDIAGFLAAIYMRGLPVVHVPTTLLAQVDSSIGGKTGVDTARGKNLLGAIHQPAAVVSDTTFLKSLPLAQVREGLAEAVKTALLDNEEFLGFIEENSPPLLNLDEDAFSEVVFRCASFKAKVVEKDERESGLRMILNLGHTLGHALEAASDYEMSHGFAVASGLAGCLALSREITGLGAAEESRILGLLKDLGLPASFPPRGFDLEKVSSHLSLDKKRRGAKLRLVLLKKIGEPEIVEIEEEELTRLLRDRPS